MHDRALRLLPEFQSKSNNYSLMCNQTQSHSRLRFISPQNNDIPRLHQNLHETELILALITRGNKRMPRAMMLFIVENAMSLDVIHLLTESVFNAANKIKGKHSLSAH